MDLEIEKRLGLDWFLFCARVYTAKDSVESDSGGSRELDLLTTNSYDYRPTSDDTKSTYQ